jgi:alpha-L-fucosidase
MNRREFLAASAAVAAGSVCSSVLSADAQSTTNSTPAARSDSYIESVPIPENRHASPAAYEAFEDMKFGIRIHWGIYSIWHRGAESWPFLPMSFEDRQRYNHLYQTWNPTGFDADQWTDIFKESGMKMFTFTTKHHEGFCMFDTKTRVRNRANWTAPGGPKIEDCDLAYSIMETPFRRDVVKELCDAAHKRGLKIDLYFSHPDWYDADFRPYGWHPLQVPSSPELGGGIRIEENSEEFWAQIKKRFADQLVIVPDPTPEEVQRMVERHRTQLTELLTQYGTIDMLGLDIAWGPKVWPQLRATILKLRQLQPDVMLRNRGIGSYGDYFTPERVIPGSNETTTMPWFVIYPLGTNFSYDPVASNYKGTEWIVHSLADTAAKGGGLQIGIGPSPNGEFHPEAIRQMKAAGPWLKVNGEAIFATRPRDGDLWSEGDAVRYTRSKDGQTVYAILTEWPGAELTLQRVRPKPGTTVGLLGSDAKMRWNYDSAKGTTLKFPASLQQPGNRPCEFAWSLKFETAKA